MVCFVSLCTSMNAHISAGDVYEDFPEDEENFKVEDSAETALEVAQKIREAANKLYKEQKFDAALDKYQSARVALQL
jgi:2C-methyl-D-erythritol 2,4-cyclodiphosphate synthase